MTISPDLDPLGDWRFELCPVSAAADVVASKGALLILRECFYGTSRFSDFALRTGMSDAVVAKRLLALLAAGVLERQLYVEPGQRGRLEYLLTERGRSFFPVLVALIHWGGAQIQQDNGRVRLSEGFNGTRVHVDVLGSTDRKLAPEEVAVSPRH